MNAKAEAYIAALRRDVHRDARLVTRMDGFTVHLPCTGCGIVEAFAMTKKIPTEQITNKLKDKGWTFERNRRATCPMHSRREKKVEQTVDKPVRSPEEKDTTSEKARRAKRETVLLLDDVFDVDKGCYRGGESDESVGRTVGLSPQAVQFIRESMFGPIKRPPELAQLFDDLKDLSGRVAAHASDARAAEEALAHELDALRKRIDAVARKYG